jgi:nucleotide-binding universal stress UspA family protein
MNGANRDSPLEIGRILVTLDASPNSLTRIRTAAELAANLRAELIGLFVEDANLLRIAELPFVREFSMYAPIGRRIRLEQLQQELRAHSERLRRALADAADAREVPWIFRMVRGSVAKEVLLAAAEADLMILGRMTWAPPRGRRLGSTVRMILSQGRGLTLVLHEETDWTPPVSVIFDGSDLSLKALNVAAHLVGIRDGGLSVFVLAPDREAARREQARVFEELEKRTLGADFRLVINPSIEKLAWLVQIRGKGGPLVLPCGGNLLEGEGLCSLVNEVSNPVLLVR